MKQITMDMDSLDPMNNSDEDVFVEEEEGPHVYTVSELNGGIRDLLEGEFPLLWIQGEVSNFKAHQASGHYYFSLKDKKAQVSAVMFRGFNRQLRFRPEDGMEVLVRGKVTVYEPRGNYQVFCEVMEPLGAGALQAAFEQLKKKLEKEGLFDAGRKRPVPSFPQHVALITSPTGAAIRDMLNVLGRRFKGLRITVVPALVQGEQAPASLVAGLSLANQIPDLDVIIIGRGGGSMEDLWGFNDEALARKIAASGVPVISAVGHEVDFTIADFVADLRAPTPSAAAELVVKNAAEVVESIRVFERRLQLAIGNRLQLMSRQVEVLKRQLVDPQRRLRDLVMRCDELTDRLTQAIGRFLEARRMRLRLTEQGLGSPESALSQVRERVSTQEKSLRLLIMKSLEGKKAEWKTFSQLLDSLSPLRVVERGYSIVKSIDGRVLKSARDIEVNEEFEIKLHEGELRAKVLVRHL
ncbi:MAG: exodeoxyribonuclease VII large subunit [Bdellovibrionaceae bacterium]|nr:exodeoxyribonuclease VII large subunit [Bdellovibrionales bacterium]MCB9086192.1 exodeoxyribonuclease VII large subunit [Pseudobdellovibrionaceae bacterium]